MVGYHMVPRNSKQKSSRISDNMGKCSLKISPTIIKSEIPVPLTCSCYFYDLKFSLVMAVVNFAEVNI